MENTRNQLTNISSSRYYLLTVAFSSGMVIMGVEMCASRLMAPYFGTSILIWTVIIGSTMIALTAGYYIGGVLAERHPRISFLGTLLFFASAFVMFLPHIARPAVDLVLAGMGAGETAQHAISLALAVCAVLISAPVMVLGMTSPFLIRLDSLNSTEVGRISGQIFALSTLGSILGTLLPALLLIPLIGTTFSFFAFGLVLLLVTLVALEHGRQLFLGIAFVLVAMAWFLGVQGWGTRLWSHLILERETNYQTVRIHGVPVRDKATGRKTNMNLLLTDAGAALQSYWVAGQPYTESWQDFFPLIPKVYEVCANGTAPRRLLVIGLGGAVAPYLIAQFYPNTIIDGVEIDGGLIDAARPYFPFSEVKNLNVHVGDGRLFLRTTRHKYDVVIVDAFRPPHIPAHLATVEFFAQIKGLLTEHGVLGMNIVARGEKRVFTGIANSVAAVFPSVYFGRYYSPSDEGPFENRFLVAGVGELSLEDPSVEDRVFSFPDPHWTEILRTMRDRRGFEPQQTSYFRRISFDQSRPYFVDDRSSLDMVSEREFFGLQAGRSR